MQGSTGTREESEEFVNSAVLQAPSLPLESAINALNHKGLGRVRDHGVRGFARCVAYVGAVGQMFTGSGSSVLKKEEEGRRRKL